MINRRFVAVAVAGLALAFSSAANAQPAADASAAPAGTYRIDQNHTAVIARVPHGGFSYEIFRFGAVAGELAWDPANAGANRLNVTVQVASIATPVDGFAAELQEPRFLNAAQFPTATFVSTAFRRTDANHGQIDGTLTIKGVAKPVTFDVELIGAGQNQRGAAIIGYRATTNINLADYSLPGFIQGTAQIVIDGEFQRQ
ncbi:YceI family protein [Terricaulis sp.]|uniref:YceI family protein n=1 Tax=Terricaulis sp. TaxID=2768686 RepID=UPI0037840D59